MACLTYRITTLGCRVNHAEASDLESILVSRRLRRASAEQPANIEIIHTCSVTNSAATKSRQAARRALRRADADACTAVAGVGQHSADSPSSHAVTHDHRTVLVTGCYASTNPREAASIFGADNVLPQTSADGSSLAERFEAHLDQWLSERQHSSDRSIRELPLNSSSGIQARNAERLVPLPVVRRTGPQSHHIRTELRIQDGCDAHCTFCIIPKIRPVLRSKRIHDAVSEARSLVDLGHQEIVLTGIFIGAYGHETALRRRQTHLKSPPLAELLHAIAQVPGVERLRISSMEPGDVTEDLLDAMVANAPTIVPHLHLPLQSGSDRILRRMNRQYTTGQYLEMVAAVNARLTQVEPGLPPLLPAITTDIICGFPGETEEDFEATISVAQQVGYLHMHVFPFSARRGTAAARWSDQTPHATRKHRVRRLIELESRADDGLAIRYHRNLVGRTVRVMIEQPASKKSRQMMGRCDHYATVTLPTTAPRGSLLHAKIISAQPDGVVGEPTEDRLPLPILSRETSAGAHFPRSPYADTLHTSGTPRFR